jgi:hypothetical protein
MKRRNLANYSEISPLITKLRYYEICCFADYSTKFACQNMRDPLYSSYGKAVGAHFRNCKNAQQIAIRTTVAQNQNIVEL